MSCFLGCFFATPSLAISPAVSCGSLTGLDIPDTSNIFALPVPENMDATKPGFCRVTGVIDPAQSTINFEVRLPDEWNGRFVGVGNGGYRGSIPTDFGGDDFSFGLEQEGYAVAGSDGGHLSSSTDASWAFMRRDLIEDFGHKATHLMTVVAKKIIDAYYNQAPFYSYFRGCSAGGRQAVMDAQRYPRDYDGLLSGAPLIETTQIGMAHVWHTRSVRNEFGDLLPGVLGKLPIVNNAVIEACDAHDGLVDGLIDDPTRCKWDPVEIQCANGGGPNCLTAAEVEAVRKIYQGPQTSDGTQIYPPLPRGSELGWTFFDFPASKRFSFDIMEGALRFFIFQDPAYDYLDFDFNSDPQFAKDEVGDLLDADNADLRPFRNNGGKIILWGGWSDGSFSLQRTVDYYDELVKIVGKLRKTQKFARLFLIPGVNHCGGGPGPNTFGLFEPLVDWVEKNKAPKRIVAENPARGFSRPLCPYPKVARYNGTGSTDEAKNFDCVNLHKKSNFWRLFKKLKGLLSSPPTLPILPTTPQSSIRNP